MNCLTNIPHLKMQVNKVSIVEIKNQTYGLQQLFIMILVKNSSFKKYINLKESVKKTKTHD